MTPLKQNILLLHCLSGFTSVSPASPAHRGVTYEALKLFSESSFWFYSGWVDMRPDLRPAIQDGAGCQREYNTNVYGIIVASLSMFNFEFTVS